MQQLTEQGWQRVVDLSQRYGVSTDAVTTLLQALVNGNGTMAQFYHQELGGGGQWMQGGMTMVGDMFNHGLKAKVDGLCFELNGLLGQQPFLPPPPRATQSQYQGGGQMQQQGGQGQQQGGGSSFAGQASLFVPFSGGFSGNWWPAELGSPNGSGSQNNIRYAYFNGARRLAVEINGRVTVYDSLDHQIGGVSQQQGGGSSLTFTSQYGTVGVNDLPVVSIDGVPAAPSTPPGPAFPEPTSFNPPAMDDVQERDVFAKIERMADLLQKGILSQKEFDAKKTELLKRL